MFETEKWTLNDLYEFQEHLVEKAKVHLEEKGELVPVSFILSRRMEISPEVRSLLVDPDSLTKVTEDEIASSPGEVAVMLVPNSYSNEMILDMVARLSSAGRSTSQVVINEVRQAAAAIFNLQDKEAIDEKAVEGLCKAMDTEPKRIFASYLRYLCHKTNAVAFLKVDEVNLKSITRESLKKAGLDLPEEITDISKVEIPKEIMKNIPKVDGVLCYLETPSLRKSVLLTFTKPDVSGAPLVWERQDLTDGNGHVSTLTGLFTGMIKKGAEDLAEKTA